MDAQQAGLCKTSSKTCQSDIDLMATFPKTQSQLLLDMAGTED